MIFSDEAAEATVVAWDLTEVDPARHSPLATGTPFFILLFWLA
jgi:hypothetical protein